MSNSLVVIAQAIVVIVGLAGCAASQAGDSSAPDASAGARHGAGYGPQNGGGGGMSSGSMGGGGSGGGGGY